MNHRLRFFLPVLPIVATVSVAAQPPSPPALVLGQANSVVETSRVARFLAGPGDRPQGLLLRNGTFVTLRPSLAQQLPPTIGRNASIRVAGDELSYNGNKTIEAHSITVAGVSYEDAAPAAKAPEAGMGTAPPPPAPRGPGAGPRNDVPPPPPAGCGPVAPPPPPASPAGRLNTPAPPPPGDAPQPPPAPAGSTPAPPAPTTPPTQK